MKILGIDTSTEACSVALRIHTEVIQEYRIQPTGHSKLVLNMVNSVLQESGIKLNQLDALAVNTGPGSFTGIRIGLGVAQGLAYGADLPVIGVCSLAVLAAAIDKAKTGTGVALPALDARMNQIYCGLYNITKTFEPVELFHPAVVEPESIPFAINSNVVGLGSGWDVYQKIIRKSMGEIQIKTISNQFPEARVLVQVAAHKGLESSVNPMQLQATYIRNKIVHNRV